MKINDIAKILDVSKKTIRIMKKMGFLHQNERFFKLQKLLHA